MDSLYSSYGICEFYFCAFAVWQPCILGPHGNSRWSTLVYVGLGILMARLEMSCCSSYHSYSNFNTLLPGRFITLFILDHSVVEVISKLHRDTACNCAEESYLHNCPKVLQFRTGDLRNESQECFGKGKSN